MKFRGSASSSTTLFGSRPRTPGKGLSRAFDLVIFDFDGTLADSQALLVDQVVKTLAAANLAIPAEAAIARTIGLPLEKVFRRAQPNADKDREEANWWKNCAESIARKRIAWILSADSSSFLVSLTYYLGLRRSVPR